MKTVAISLGLGDLYDEGGTGPLRVPPDGGIARFKAITTAVPSRVDTLVVCTAGYSRRSPAAASAERRVSLADQLVRYVRRHEPAWLGNLVARPLCWGTRHEVRLGIKLAQRTGFADRHEQVRLVLASNLAHCLRIRLYAALYAPKRWETDIVRAHHAFSLLSHLLEPPKITRDLLYLLRVLHRLRRRRIA